MVLPTISCYSIKKRKKQKKTKSFGNTNNISLAYRFYINSPIFSNKYCRNFIIVYDIALYY